MKLRNKRSGEIVECAVIPIVDGYVNEYEVFEKGDSLTELNENWEDYEEPKAFYYITGDCYVVKANDTVTKDFADDLESIGNYFETKEKAEKAVEKLKAWKRLKDNGFKFQFWTSSYSGDNIAFFIDWINVDSKKEIEEDLDLLFGGEK